MCGGIPYMNLNKCPMKHTETLSLSRVQHNSQDMRDNKGWRDNDTWAVQVGVNKKGCKNKNAWKGI